MSAALRKDILRFEIVEDQLFLYYLYGLECICKILVIKILVYRLNVVANRHKHKPQMQAVKFFLLL